MRFAAWRLRELARLEAGSRVVSTRLGPVEYAEVGSGPVFLALHGRPGGYDQGLLIARTLGIKRGRWIAVSRPGYLRTPLSSGKSPAEQADLYAALLDELDVGKAVVVALSGGGPSALQFALRHRERCRGLVLVSTVTRRRPKDARHAGQKFLDDVVYRSDWFSRLLYGTLGALVPSQAKEGLATVFVLPRELRWEGLRNDLDRFSELPESPPTGISVPTLVVHGTADRVVLPAHSEEAAAAIPGSRLLRLPGAGHDALFTRAGEVRQALDAFLASFPVEG